MKPPRSVEIHFLLSSCLCTVLLVILSRSNEAFSCNSFLVRTSFSRSCSVSGLNLIVVECKNKVNHVTLTYWKPLKVDCSGSCALKMNGLRYVPVSPVLSSVDAS